MLSFSNSPSLLTTYRPRKPVAPKTVAAIPLEDERPPFPLGMTAWCSFLCWTVVTAAAENTAGEQPPIEKRGTHRQELRYTESSIYFRYMLPNLIM